MKRRIAVVLLCLQAAACALQPRIPGTEVRWDQRREQLLALPAWELQGRIAIKAGDEGGQGSLQWLQEGESARLRLSGPFGAGAYEIRWDAREVMVTSSDGEVSLNYQGPDAIARFLDEQLGWSFPAGHARYWVLGVPAPAQRSRERFDESGWLAGIEQGGWTVSYESFVERHQQWMPRKITLQDDTARIRVVVDRWNPSP